MCGLPFKKLDKKSEKQFLFDRRQRLIQILESINDHNDAAGVLDVTIMLLFQQIKQVVVGGSLLRGPILQMLLQERKITPSVATVLRTLATSLQTGDPVNESLVAAVKQCGLCRDVTKLQLEGY
jgi:hypothetical protein